MPELPEVQTVVNTLRPRVLGAKITGVDTPLPKYVRSGCADFSQNVLGGVIEDIHRRGKRIIFKLEAGERFIIHLGMTGRLTVESPGSQCRKHTHFVLHVRKGNKQSEIRLCDPRQFGRVIWLGQEPADSGLGFEPLTARPRQLAVILSASHRPIKPLLLDQTKIAGLGNIYVDESLYAAGIHPLTPADAINAEGVRRLSRAIKSVLKRALRHHGSTLRDYVDAEGAKGSFQNLHNVYARPGKPCRQCGTGIERIILGGRSTCFCPRCQPRYVPK